MRTHYKAGDLMIHPAFEYRKPNARSMEGQLIVYQSLFEQLEIVKIELLLARASLFITTNLEEKEKLLKEQALLNKEIGKRENDLKLCLESYNTLSKNKEIN